MLCANQIVMQRHPHLSNMTPISGPPKIEASLRIHHLTVNFQVGQLLTERIFVVDQSAER